VGAVWLPAQLRREKRASSKHGSPFVTMPASARQLLLPHAKGEYQVRYYANGRVAAVNADVTTG